MCTVTIINPVTYQFEIYSLHGKNPLSDIVSMLFYNAWLYRYSRPTRIMYNNRSELKKYLKALCKECDLNQYPIIVKNS